MTGSRPAALAARTARRTTRSPSSSKRSLLRPMRDDVPAASTTPATAPVRSTGMNEAFPFPQVPRLAAGQHGEEFGDHAQRNLFRPIGAEIEAHGPEHAAVSFGAQLTKQVVDAVAWSEHADVGHVCSK